MAASQENKQNQKLFGEQNPVSKSSQDKIFIKDSVSDLLKMNLMKQQNSKPGFQKNNYDFDLSGGDSSMKSRGVKPEADEDYDYDDEGKNIEDGLEELDPDAFEYGGLELDNGDDLLDEEEDYEKMRPAMKKNIGGQLNFFNGLDDDDFFGGGSNSKKRNFKRGNLSD